MVAWEGIAGVVYLALKRAMDVVVAATVLITLLPLMLVIGIIIRIDSPGPALFRQTRLGRYGSPFTLYKFRTMWVDARERFPALYAYRYSDDEIRELHFHLTDDPRLTRVGRWLRTTSLDELPNLINVLRGELSLVGPRPQIPEMLPYYPEEYRQRFAVKPGLAGLAQVSGRSALTFRETMVADLETCRQLSLWFDVTILLRMLKCVTLRAGAR